jgi:hypothetical protein
MENYELPPKRISCVRVQKPPPYIMNMTLTSSQVGRMVEAKLIAPTSTNQWRGKKE